MFGYFSLKGFDHLEFYVGNARQAAMYYEKVFGFINTSYRGLEKGYRKAASYVMEQGNIRFVFSTGFNPDHFMSKSVLKHSDSIAVIALEVDDVNSIYRESIKRGALGVIPPTQEEDELGIFYYAAIQIYGDIWLKFVDRSHYTGAFAPGFETRHQKHKGVGLTNIDHVVANVELGMMDHWAQFFAQTLGFKLLVEFDEKTISTEYSALRSKVMCNSTGTIKLPINEPALGKRKSQIQEYLEYNNGPGIQHVALGTKDIIETVSQLKMLGMEFLSVPLSYYDNLVERVGNIEKPIEKLAELGILVDRDHNGHLFQIFTQPVEDRPTLFFEVIERRGAQGFGEGNFKALFEAIEREQEQRGNLQRIEN